MQQQDTIISLATPAQQSALGLIRVSGPRCKTLCNDIFGLPSPTPRKSILRNFKSITNKVVDQTIFVFYTDGKSFTGEDMIEITFHGNMLIANQILDDLIKRDCRIAEPGEYSRRAFLNDKIDLTQAESIANLISAKSEVQLTIAKKQLAGAISNILLTLQDQLINIQAQLEALIDFPEDEIDEPNYTELVKSISKIIENISKLNDSHSLNENIYQTIKVSLIGPPNAGKSSIFNKLLSEDRAIVSETPGTTRDYISKQIILDGYLVELFDTAGIRDNASEVENIGIQHTVNIAHQSNLILLVIDQSLPYPIEFIKKIGKFVVDENIVMIKNKSDLDSSASNSRNVTNHEFIETSIFDKYCTKKIFDKIKVFIDKTLTLNVTDGAIVNKRQFTHLKHTLVHLKSAKVKMVKKQQEELILQELKLGLDWLNQVIGTKTNEDMLDKLFNDFCIGK